VAGFFYPSRVTVPDFFVDDGQPKEEGLLNDCSSTRSPFWTTPALFAPIANAHLVFNRSKPEMYPEIKSFQNQKGWDFVPA
jgi:hypothetical protein